MSNLVAASAFFVLLHRLVSGFAAILNGRQPLHLRELDARRLALAAALSILFWAAHPAVWRLASVD